MQSLPVSSSPQERKGGEETLPGELPSLRLQLQVPLLFLLFLVPLFLLILLIAVPVSLAPKKEVPSQVFREQLLLLLSFWFSFSVQNLPVPLL